jgi:hypothetical protein
VLCSTIEAFLLSHVLALPDTSAPGARPNPIHKRREARMRNDVVLPTKPQKLSPRVMLAIGARPNDLGQGGANGSVLERVSAFGAASR